MTPFGGGFRTPPALAQSHHPIVIKASQTCGRLSPPGFKDPAGEMPMPPERIYSALAGVVR
jgi:hypothetical protein